MATVSYSREEKKRNPPRENSARVDVSFSRAQNVLSKTVLTIPNEPLVNWTEKVFFWRGESVPYSAHKSNR